MGKVNISTAQGQTAALDEASVDLPIQQQTSPEPRPEPGGSILEGIVAQAGVQDIAEGVAAGVEREAAVAEQKEREQVQPLAERLKDTERVDRWEAKAVNAESGPDTGDGGLFKRARKFSNDFQNKKVNVSVRPGKDAFAAFKEGGVPAMIEAEAQRDEGSFLAAINRAGAVEYNTDPAKGGINPQVDPAYLTIGAAVTENIISELAHGTQEETLAPEVAAQLEEDAPGTPVSKAQQNSRLGQQIHREYMRRKNVNEGKPVDDYQDLPKQEAETLGDAFKEMWARSMGPEMVTRAQGGDGQVYFQLTHQGNQEIRNSAKARKRMFPKQTVRPQKTPTGQIKGEQRRDIKKVTGKVGTPVGMETLQKAANNLNQVPNVVDKQRMRILFSTILPALSGKEGLDGMGAIINNFGADKMAKFQAQQADAEANGDLTYSADENMAALQDSIAQSIRGVAMERNGANHFTYTIGAFNGRMFPQQTAFDATASKAVRFVTRNAVPAKATPGSRIDKNLRQMYAMMLVKGADALLPSGREKELQRNQTKLYAWGNRLQQVLDSSMTDAEAEAVAQAIEQGMSLLDPNFPQVRGFQLDPNQDADLIQQIKNKGEDGPHFIDGLIDFKNYIDAHKAGKPYHSYFNAYMDGKTNGIASNGIQMGSREVALATGVIRNNKKELLDDGDIRDQLKKDLLHNLYENGFDGTIENTQAITDVARAVYSWRDLNKATTMTFGYGKELSSFKKDIGETISYLNAVAQSGDTAAIEKAGLQTYAQSLAAIDAEFEGKDGQKPGREVLTETLLNMYNESLAGVLSEEAIKSRSLMRSSAVIHAVANELMSIKSYTGFDLNLGGMETLGWDQADHTYYEIHEDGERKGVRAAHYQNEATSAAIRRRINAEGELEFDVGGDAYGGSLPGPVQSLDAATVALTSSGRSWNKLKEASGGNPYLHTIYDAFKVDAMGYDVVLDEVNKNWLDASMQWSYLEQTYEATKRTMEKFNEKMKGLDNNAPINIGLDGEWRMMGYLLENQGDKRVWPKRLANKLNNLLDIPDGLDAEGRRQYVNDVTKNIMDAMNQAGYNWDDQSQAKAGHLKVFMRALNEQLQLGHRMRGMIEHTNNKKKELAAEIKKSGPVYQYYAH